MCACRIDGLQFYDRVKSRSSTSTPPVLFVSGIPDMRHLKDLGVPNKIAFVSKPFEVDTFLSAVKTLIDT